MAGPHHFVDLWARDSLFACLGGLAIGDVADVKKTLETFLSHQRADGLIPYRVMRSRSTITKYLGKPTYLSKPVANFRSHQSGGIVPDGGLLMVILSLECYKKTNDKKFIVVHYPALIKTMKWYLQNYGDGLIREWFLCEWADAILKVGVTLYTNVLYVKALQSMGELANIVKNTKEVIVYQRLARTMKANLDSTLWNGTYYSDWKDWKRHDYFASHANFLAILFDLVDKKNAEGILTYARTHSLNTFTIENNYPKYPFWRIPFYQWIAGMKDYHNRGCLWLQPGILYSLCLHKLGHKKEAKDFFSLIENQIVKHNEVYEVYERDGNPVKRTLYTSEGPFAWSAGLFLFAQKIMANPKR
jgi:glycogen debranching enzyme